jgi:L-rhamnose-H+ transport protein
LVPNPAVGVFFHWLGGFASGSFYVPFKGVRNWSWETLWTVGGIFSWIVAPVAIGSLMTNNLFAVLRETPPRTIFWCYFFGLLWGFGGLTFGLTVRYLGLSLGTAIALGYCAAFGTLIPPIFRGDFQREVLETHAGQTILLGIFICICGIAVAGIAGMSKEKELSSEERAAAIKEFDLKKGVMVATFCGIMSACFSYALAAGDSIRTLTLQHGTPALWQGLPVLVIVLLGGFTTNLIWCAVLHSRNRTAGEYFRATLDPITENESDREQEGDRRVPLLRNYTLSALAGVTWYFQFFFYTMGETQMGRYHFSSWTLHMASIMIFGTAWGLALREWRGTGTRTRALLALSMTSLIASTIVVGYGNYLASPNAPEQITARIMASPRPPKHAIPEPQRTQLRSVSAAAAQNRSTHPVRSL